MTQGIRGRRRVRTLLSLIMPLVMLIATAVPMLAQAAPTAAEESWPQPTVLGELGRGDALFWDGPYLESVGTGTRTADRGFCESPAATTLACEVGSAFVQPAGLAADFGSVVLDADDPFCGSEHACFAYAFDVTDSGEVLRVALDHPSMRDVIFVYLYDPSGAWVGKLTKFGTELRFEDPETGRWEARVQVYDARDTSFRMRAALDPDERPHGPGRARGPKNTTLGTLLPNLQVVPPHEFGFGPCQATEVVDYGARRCLRFSTGPQNVGDGPLDLIVTDTASTQGEMLQRLHYSDGSTETVPAGGYEYHLEHMHYHKGAIQSLELLRVVDERRGVLEPAGVGPKIGFCLAPYFIAEWETFAQDPPFGIYEDDACQNAAGPVTPPTSTQMALARGFADIYTYWIEGNFVEFGDNPDGLYVVRAAADPDREVRETRDDDNVAYAYIHVTGDEIDVLERGRGRSPWDPHGAVVDDGRRAIRWTEEALPLLEPR